MFVTSFSQSNRSSRQSALLERIDVSLLEGVIYRSSASSSGVHLVDWFRGARA